MSEKIIGFLMWVLFGGGFVALGLYGFFTTREKPIRFWANVQDAPIAPENVRAYNRALGKLWIAYGAGLIFLGMPILGGSDALIVISTSVGVVLLTIGMIVIFMFGIESKYRKK